MLTASLAGDLARIALDNVVTEYPYRLDQVLAGAQDLQPPRALHPAFWGSYDWHSCVHMHWTLARLLRRFPAHREAARSLDHLQGRLTSAAIAGELASLRAVHRQTFERPYGWAWLLKLAAELQQLAAVIPEMASCRDALRPLADEFADRFSGFLPRADFPNRAGTHGNSAFALLLALDWCDTVQHRALRATVVERAHRWFGQDRSYPAAYEPGGEDFLAAGLVEAALMDGVMTECSFADWWEQFRPADTDLANWLSAVAVSDSGDARIVHLHGVNLSRAWCWRRLRSHLSHPLQQTVENAIAAQIASSLPASVAGDYVGTHWLASFALLALDDAGDSSHADSAR